MLGGGARKNGRGMERRESLETMAKRVNREGGRERKSDSLTAAPNGFSGEREGVLGRQRHNERAMTQAQIDVERDGGRDKERWRLYGRWVNMESERGGALNEQRQE